MFCLSTNNNTIIKGKRPVVLGLYRLRFEMQIDTPSLLVIEVVLDKI
jgi:hypothetical protein